MDLSAISNDDDFTLHTMRTPESIINSSSSSRKLFEGDGNEHKILHHHRRIRISRPQMTLKNDLNTIPSSHAPSPSLRHRIESMSVDELRIALLEKAKEAHKLAAEVQSRSEENFHLRQLMSQFSRPGMSQSRSSCCSPPPNTSAGCRITEDFHSTLCEYDENSLENKEVADEDEYEENFLIPEDLKMIHPSRMSVIISQSMTVLAQINNEEVIEKMCAGSQIVKKFAVGGVAGYLTSHLLRKFGKFAATSILGSVIFIKVAHQRGYISVDWNRIKKQIEPTNIYELDQEHQVEEDIAWISQKVQQARTWSRQNTYTVIGFWSGFLLHNFHT